MAFRYLTPSENAIAYSVYGRTRGGIALKRHKMRSCIAPGIVISFQFLCVQTSVADHANPKLEMGAGFIEAEHEYNKGRCQNAWTLYWKQASVENSYASAWIVSTVYIFNAFHFSGVSTSEKADIAVPMIFYALRYHERSSDTARFGFPFVDLMRRLIPEALVVLRPKGPDSTRTRACLRSDAPAPECVETAIGEGVIPTYEDYVKNVQRLNSEKLKVDCDHSMGR